MRHLLALVVLLATTATAAAGSQYEFRSFEIPGSGRIVLPVQEGEALSGIAAEVDSRTDGALSTAASEAGFTGASGETLTVYAARPYARVDLVGLGSGPIDRVAAENYGGMAESMLRNAKGGAVDVLWKVEAATDDATAARVAFGYELGGYRFDRLRANKVDETTLPLVRILSDQGSGEQYETDLRHLAEGVYLARNMPSEPANVIYPQSFVDRIETRFDDVDDVRIKVLDEKDLERLGMGAHLGVGKGSSRPPRLLVVEYMGGGDEAPVVLAGKGITFDSGGISLKGNDNMWMMKGDLGGAAVVMGTVLANAKRGAPVNLVGIAALAENMPSGTAIRPGDVLTTMSGITVEIRSTDAEGRLVLSDAVHYAQVNYAPSVLIDVATLTGSVGRALGDDYAGVFGRHDELIEKLEAAADAAGEPIWQLPLDDTHFKQIESSYGDIINSGAGNPGASVGAAFIGSFVADTQVWAHFDIAGVDIIEEARPTIPKGYSGWGVRLLDEYLRKHHANP